MGEDGGASTRGRFGMGDEVDLGIYEKGLGWKMRRRRAGMSRRFWKRI